MTEEGLAFAEQVGHRIGQSITGRTLRVVSGETLRTRQTATAVAAGARRAGADVTEPRTAFALRNPDLYLGGERVDMVSSIGALAAQVPELGEQAADSPFFSGFLAASDRIGFWLTHPAPPGDDAATVAARINAWAASLSDLPAGQVTVGVTHSPVLRACGLALGADPGEPAWVSGLRVQVLPDRATRIQSLNLSH